MYAWNIVSKLSIIIEIDFILQVHSSPGNVLRKLNSKCNGFICFLLFFYLMSFKAKYRSLVICKITRSVDKDKQLAWTSILKAMMMLKKAWGWYYLKWVDMLGHLKLKMRIIRWNSNLMSFRIVNEKTRKD